jgi:hypothetical protein
LMLGSMPVSSSPDLSAWLLPREETALPAGTALDDRKVPELRRGASTRSIEFTIPVDELEFLETIPWGVLPLWAEYRAGDADAVIGRTSIVWEPSEPNRRAGFATAMPLSVPPTETGILDADTLARYTGPAGLLTRQLDAVEGRPVAVGIDPMILASIRLLADAAPEDAVAWLERLEELENETFALAYADTDLAAVSQAADTVLSPQNFDFALDPTLFPVTPETQEPQSSEDAGVPAGDEAPPTASADPSATPNPSGTPETTPDPGDPVLPSTEELLAWDYTLENVAWPAPGSVTTADLETFADAGLETTILSERNVVAGRLSTQSHTRIGNHEALTSDSLLTTLLRNAASARPGEEWESAVAALGAALAVVTTEHTGTPPLSLATLDRAGMPLQGRLGETLDALERLDWVNTTSLEQLLERPARSTRLVDRPVNEDTVRVISRMLRAHAAEAGFATIAADPTDITAPRRLRALGLLSQAWRETPDTWTDSVSDFLSESRDLRRAVQLVEGSDLNINNELQRLPVSIANNLSIPVTVLVDVRSLSPQLHIEESPVEIVVEPDSAAREFVIPVRPLANGRATIEVSLLTPDGKPIGSDTRLTLNVQADWGTPVAIGLGVLVVGLIGAGLYRTARRNRRDRDGSTADD